jgi:hypothetical protein
MNSFWREWTTGDLTARDELQFELKSDIFIHSDHEDTVFKQEFFIFVPAALQINKNSYSKDQFYRDETNLIRYKTPIFTLQEIIHSKKSPLNRIPQIHALSKLYKSDSHSVLDEIRLFGNIFRSALRNRVYDLLMEMQSLKSPSTLTLQFEQLLSEVDEICKMFRGMRKEFMNSVVDPALDLNFRQVDEFISNTIQDLLTILLKNLRDYHLTDLSKVNERFTATIISEKKYLESHFSPVKEESLLHRQSVLNRFILESLLLKSNRIAVEEEYKHYVGSLAAGSAMLIYMLLFAWKSSEFVINSTPFILLAVFLYIVKDRLKEWLKNLYTQQAFKWFPDYKTQILDWGGHVIGELTESFSFITKDKVPQDFFIKNRHKWEEELSESDFEEGIMFYKREVTLYSHPRTKKARRSEINTFFRLSIHHLLQKASDPVHMHLELNSVNSEISLKRLPKIYYIYVLVHEFYIGEKGIQEEEVKTYRLVVNKRGIKRVELI